MGRVARGGWSVGGGWAVLLVACGGSPAPRVPDTAPFAVLGESDVHPVGAPASNAGPGLSGAASPVKSLQVDHDRAGALRVSWQNADLRVRVFDGSAWSDQRVKLRGGSGPRVHPWEVALTPDGPAAVGGELPGVTTLPALGLVADGEQGEVPWTGAVDGTWGVDPQGRPVYAHFAGARVQVRRWDGQAWSAVGEGDPARGYRAGDRLGPALAFEPDGDPIVAWREPYLVPPVKDGPDRLKATRWRTVVWRWNGDELEVLAGADGPLDEDPRDRYPQAAPSSDDNPRGEWEAAQDGPPRLALTASGRVVVAWDTLDGVLVWALDGRSWTRLPDPVDLPGDAIDVDLLAQGETIVVAWAHAFGADRRSPREIQVRRWDGSAWTAPGGATAEGASRTGGPSFGPRLGLHEGQPVVAWIDGTSGAQEVLLARLDGTSWVGLPDGRRAGGLAEPERDASPPAVVIGPTGPRVAWLAWDPFAPEPNAELRLATWDGQGWVPGAGSPVAGRPGSLRAVATGESLVALWDQRVAEQPRELVVARHDGTGWAALGDKPLAERVAAGDADLAVDRDGAPWVAFAQGGRAVQVRRWAGDGWLKVGEVPGATAAGVRPVVAVGSTGRPWLAWAGPSANRDVDVKVGWFDGSDWQTVGDSWWLACEPNELGEVPAEVAMALGPDDRPVVAWRTEGVVPERRGKAKAEGAPPAIQVCAWDGRAWEPLPSPVEGAGLRVADSRSGNLDLDAADGPMVAWSEGGEGGRQIRAARWDGSSWIHLGDRGGVVSECDSACWSPSLAVGGAWRCLAWEEQGDRTANVSARCQSAP